MSNLDPMVLLLLAKNHDALMHARHVLEDLRMPMIRVLGELDPESKVAKVLKELAEQEQACLNGMTK